MDVTGVNRMMSGVPSDLRDRMMEKQLSDLRRLASSGNEADRGRVKDAARKFESYFLEQLLTVMQQTVDAWKEKDEAPEAIQMSMVYSALAERITEGGGIGIAKLIEESLARNRVPTLVGETPSVTPQSLIPPRTPETPLLTLDRCFAPTFSLASKMPVRGRISSAFGERPDPFTGRPSFHRGIDIAVPVGTPVDSIENGVVTYSGPRGTTGQTVMIQHEDGRESVYGHLNEIRVTVGQVVKNGDVIGLSGNSGRSTGPHLHFEVHKSGKPVDPKAIVDFD